MENIQMGEKWDQVTSHTVEADYIRYNPVIIIMPARTQRSKIIPHTLPSLYYESGNEIQLSDVH
jgi:hypothetical protein